MPILSSLFLIKIASVFFVSMVATIRTAFECFKIDLRQTLNVFRKAKRTGFISCPLFFYPVFSHYGSKMVAALSLNLRADEKAFTPPECGRVRAP
jgi:hypothetical protein